VRDVKTNDRRTLRVHEGGDPDGAPVLVEHGTPMTGQLFGPHVEDARRRGIRLIGYDRPGYGGSTAHEDRSVADAAADVVAIADSLGLERIAVWGISGGGPHALACAALLPERVVGVASLASVAPSDAEDLDWTAGMGEANLEEFEATRRGRAALEQYLRGEAEGLLASDADQLVEALQSLLTPVDAAALTGELAAYMADSMLNALRGSIDGWLDDDLAFVEPWGFGVEEIRVPVLLWQGRQDRFVPPAHGDWLAARIPGVDARISDEDGHLTLLARRIPEVHAWLLQQF
jgi:pimeloyl-ACP methyl ester carboxylesterase